MSTRSNRFKLNREKRRFLGVCASLADYLEVPTAVIRIICLLACLIWPTLIIVYFIAYWWLQHTSDEGAGKMHHMLSASRAAQHFRQVDYAKTLYRNPYKARIAGVCSGIADYLEIKPGFVRLATLLSLFLFGPFTFFAYGVCWIVLERNPDGARHSGSQNRQQHARQQNRQEAERDNAVSQELIAMSLRQCADVFTGLETRLREVEAFMTSKKFRLHCEINRI